MVDSCSEGKLWWFKGVICAKRHRLELDSRPPSGQGKIHKKTKRCHEPLMTCFSPVGKWMLRKKTPPSNGESEGPTKIKLQGLVCKDTQNIPNMGMTGPDYLTKNCGLPVERIITYRPSAVKRRSVYKLRQEIKWPSLLLPYFSHFIRSQQSSII